MCVAGICGFLDIHIAQCHAVVAVCLIGWSVSIFVCVVAFSGMGVVCFLHRSVYIVVKRVCILRCNLRLVP